MVGSPDAVLKQAIAADATEQDPIAEEYGCRVGRGVDPLGHEREIGRPVITGRYRGRSHRERIR
jgi:hypothetical protein